MNKKPGLEPGFLLDELLVRSVPDSDFRDKNGYGATFHLARSFLVRQSMRFRE